MEREPANVIERDVRIVTNIVTTPTDAHHANDAKTAENGCLLTPTDAHRRNYSPPEPKVVGSS